MFGVVCGLGFGFWVFVLDNLWVFGGMGGKSGFWLGLWVLSWFWEVEGLVFLGEDKLVLFVILNICLMVV